MFVLSIDAGTQSVRAALVDLEGRLHHLEKTPAPRYASPEPGWAELDAEAYWGALRGTVQTVLSRARAAGLADGAIAAVALTTQRTTVVPVDREGRPLRPAILWLDQRKADPVLPAWARPALSLLGLWSFLEYVTQYARSNWLQQREPELWARTHKFLFLSGFLTHRLVGAFRDSAASVVGPVPFDVRRLDWAGRWDLKWRLFPMDRDKLPELVRPTAVLGTITRAAAEATGLPEGLPLIAAAADKACDLLGAGCVSSEQACISFGTTATLDTHTRPYVELRPLHPPFPSAIPGEFHSEVSVLRGLWMVTWFLEEFGQGERARAQALGVAPESLLDALLAESPPGSLGLLCLPQWTAGPDREQATRGALIGFSAAHTRAHVYRSILEGIVFALHEGRLRTERAHGVPIVEIRATGGGARSDALLQLTADVFGLPVRRPHTHETALVGAAIDAAVGARLLPDFGAAVAAMTRVERTFEPNAEHHARYRALFERVYAGLYGALRPLYARLQAVEPPR